MIDVYNIRFPGQYYQAETGLNQNVNRDYDPLTGRYIESDPLGLSAGINTYGYVFSNPVQWADPSGLARQLDPNSEECKALAKKIENIKKDIEKRMREYEENPGNLPESVPGGKPRDSREGHLGLIKDLQETLALELPRFRGRFSVLVTNSRLPPCSSILPAVQSAAAGGRSSAFSNSLEKSTA